MRVTYNKLVRDRIPEIIQSQGHRAVTHVLDDDSYHAALLAKLVEEAQEARDASAQELPAELADVLQVLQALAGCSRGTIMRRDADPPAPFSKLL